MPFHNNDKLCSDVKPTFRLLCSYAWHLSYSVCLERHLVKLLGLSSTPPWSTRIRGNDDPATIQSINQSINQSVSQSVNQSMNQSMGKRKTTNQSIEIFYS